MDEYERGYAALRVFSIKGDQPAHLWQEPRSNEWLLGYSHAAFDGLAGFFPHFAIGSFEPPSIPSDEPGSPGIGGGRDRD